MNEIQCMALEIQNLRLGIRKLLRDQGWSKPDIDSTIREFHTSAFRKLDEEVTDE